MEAREVRALEILSKTVPVYRDGIWLVASGSGSGDYRVDPLPDAPTCNCPDFEARKPGLCKHILLVWFHILCRNSQAQGTELVARILARLYEACSDSVWSPALVVEDRAAAAGGGHAEYRLVRLEKVVAAVQRQHQLMLQQLVEPVRRIADAVAPPKPSMVGTPYVAQRRGWTPARVSQLARAGRIPARCLVPGSGDGSPWMFRTDEIDKWLRDGCPLVGPRTRRPDNQG